MQKGRSVKKISSQKIKEDTAEVGKILEYIQGIAEVKSYNLSGTMTLSNCAVMQVCAFMLFNALEAGENYAALLRTVDIWASRKNRRRRVFRDAHNAGGKSSAFYRKCS